MKIKNILSMMAAVALAAALTGCYEKYNGPENWTRYDDQWFTDKGYSIESIATVKQLFSDPDNDLVDHMQGTPDNPNVIPGTAPTNVPSYGRYYLVEEMYVIKGKVISNDVYGNFYNSILVQDEDGGGIEVKLGLGGLYTKYPPGQTVYVVCKGLALGNYRSTLSLGLEPTSDDHSDSNEPYANKNMQLQSIVDEHVFRGPATKLVAADTLVVAAGQSLTDAQFSALCGRLVRVEGLVSKWVAGTFGNSPGYPSFLYKSGFNSYTMYNFQWAMDQWAAYKIAYDAWKAAGEIGTAPDKPTPPEPQNNYLNDPQPSWGFQEHNDTSSRNYGSALFTKAGYTGASEIIIRSSGYSRFALRAVTPDTKTVNVTGVVAFYTDKQGRNPAYQFTVNNVSDIVQVD